MDDDTLELLVMSYGMTNLLEQLDIEPVYVLKLLLEQGEIEEERIWELAE